MCLGKKKVCLGKKKEEGEKKWSATEKVKTFLNDKTLLTGQGEFTQESLRG